MHRSKKELSFKISNQEQSYNQLPVIPSADYLNSYRQVSTGLGCQYRSQCRQKGLE